MIRLFRGAAAAIADAGRAGEIVVTGFDAMPDALTAIQEGRMDATIRQAIRDAGYLPLRTTSKV